MVNEQEYAVAVVDHENGDIAEAQWGAQASLRRHTGLDGAADESSSLLGTRRSSSAGSNNVNKKGAEWEGYAELEGLSFWNRPSVYWLLPAFFLFALAAGGILVPKLNLILSLICRDYLVEKSSKDPSFIFTPVLLGAENPQCHSPEIQAMVTKFMLYMTLVIGILSAIMAPGIGSVSDRYGRLKLLIIASSGAFLTEIITIAAATYPDQIHYRWLLVGAVFDGLCGSFTAAMALTHAYAADCTAPPKRAVSFGFLHACLFSGIALGPLLVALSLKHGGSLISVFYVALGIHTFFICFLTLLVPESLSKKRQLLAREKSAAESDARAHLESTWFNTFKKLNILEPLKVLWPTGPGSSNKLRANLILLAGVDTTIFGIAMGAMFVVVYYSGYQFNWDTSQTSVFVSVVNTCRVLALILILPLLNYIFRTRVANRQRRESGFAIPLPNSGTDSIDLATIRFAVFLEFLGYGGYAVARTPGLFFLSGILAACGGIGSPTLQSALTKHVPHDKVGSLLGATGLLHALARIVCPAIFNLIYAQTVGKFTQAVFVVLTGCFAVAFVFSWFIRPNVYLKEPDNETGNVERARTDLDPDVLADEIIGI